MADRLTGNDLVLFKAPYVKDGDAEALSVPGIIKRNRKIVPQRLSLVIAIQYDHPDASVAAKVANLFVDEYITYNARVRIDESMKAVDDLKVRAEEQRKKVDELAVKLQNYREKSNLVSLDQRKDIVTEKLKALNLYVTQTSARLKDAEVRWNQVRERVEAGGNLLDLSFISGQQSGSTSMSHVTQLSQQLSSQKIVIAQMRERYRDKHPKMIEALNSLVQTERELKKAIDSAAASVKSEYETAVRNHKEAKDALVAQEAESMDLDRNAVEYTNLERDYKINEQILQHILGVCARPR